VILVLLGGGGHAISCLDVIESTGLFEVIGIITPAKTDNKTHLPWLGTDDDLDNILSDEVFGGLVTLGQIKTAEPRKQLFARLEGLSLKSPPVISPHAYTSGTVKVGDGTIVMHRALLNANACVGENSIINSGAIIEHEVCIGDNCHVSTGAIINGGVRIESDCFIGSGAVIHQSVTIGKGSIIPAGSIVAGDTNCLRSRP